MSELRPATIRPRLGRVQVLTSLALALIIVIGAWFVSGRLGLSEMGQGGLNGRYLPSVGETAPQLAMLDGSDQIVELSDFRGQPVWINFWGSWCDPCKVEFPAVQSAYQDLAPDGLVLLAISVNEPWEQAARFAEISGGTFPVYNIPTMAIFGETWDNRNFPTHIYLDAEGVIRYISTEVGTPEGLTQRGRWLIGEGYRDQAALELRTDAQATLPGRKTYASRMTVG